MDNFYPIRLIYRKKGRMKYISHLDINRVMQRALRRSGLPIWYSQGFNPHPYITFALPLSLGFASEYECMDFRLTQEVDFDSIVDSMNQVLPDGLETFYAGEPKEEIAAITKADYQIRFFETETELLKESIQSFLNQPEIITYKKTKKGKDKRILINHMIYQYTFFEQPTELILAITLSAGNQMCNPNLLLKTYQAECKKNLPHYEVTRTMIYGMDNQKFL